VKLKLKAYLMIRVPRRVESYLSEMLKTFLSLSRGQRAALCECSFSAPSFPFPPHPSRQSAKSLAFSFLRHSLPSRLVAVNVSLKRKLAKRTEENGER